VGLRLDILEDVKLSLKLS